jgi:hypothetical protein
MEPTATLATITDNITKLTKAVWDMAERENLDISVRWLTQMPRNTFMLFDPKRDEGWAHLELLQPGVPEDLRPTTWFTKARFPAFYSKLVEAFERQWKFESEDPTWKPYAEVADGKIYFCLTTRRPTTIYGVRIAVQWPGFYQGAPLQASKDNLLGELDEAKGGRVCFTYPDDLSRADTVRSSSGEWTTRWSLMLDRKNYLEVAYGWHEVCVPQAD